LMGLPGSGKSFVKDRRYLIHSGFIDIDPDEIKKLHPNYDPEKNPVEVHEWSFAEAESLMRRTLPTGNPFILDGTGTNPAKMAAKMEEAKRAGYRIFLVYVYTPLEIALWRNRNRERFVLESIILRKANQIDGSFSKLRSIANKSKVIANYSESERNKALEDLKLYPYPLDERPPRPGDSEYGMGRAAAEPKKEYSLIMFKPLAFKKGKIGPIKSVLESIGAVFEACKKLRANKSLMAEHYREHSGRSFFDQLLEYYDGKEVQACRVSGEKGIILKIRRKLGPSDPLLCSIGQLRYEAVPFVETGETCKVDNMVHASDSFSSAKRELSLWGLAPGRAASRFSSFVPVFLGEDAWTQWNDFDLNNKEIADTAYALGLDVRKEIMLRGFRCLSIEVQKAAKGITVWFLPDEMGILPIYIKAGERMVYRAKSGGTKGEKLGWGAKTVAQNLIAISQEKNEA